MNTSDFKVKFRFYEELNDFLPTRFKKVSFFYSIKNSSNIKEVIESIGVPHTEIDLILVNGKSVDFNYHLKQGDSVSVFPVFESLDISRLTHLRPKPLRKIKFILDVHLGKLAKYLRMLGFDAIFNPQLDDATIIQLALRERRIILTRDKGLLKDKRVTHGYWVRSINLSEQLIEVIKRFDLVSKINPFTRCLLCNHVLVGLEIDSVTSGVFNFCEFCKKLYWKGSHYDNMKKWMDSLLKKI